MNLPENGAMGPDCRRRRPCWQKMREGGLAIHGLGRIPGPRRTYDLRFCHDATYHERPIAPLQRMMGCNRAPLWHFLTPERRNSAIRMRGNQRQSSNQHQAFKMRLKLGHAHQISKMRLGRTIHARRPKKQASRGGVVRKRWHHKCAIGRQSRTRRCATMNELLRGQECLRMRRAASVPQ